MKDSNGVTVQVGDSIDTLYQGIQVVTSISECGNFWRIRGENNGSCSHVTIVPPYTEPTYLTRRAELIEALELVDTVASVYYDGEHSPNPTEVAAKVYPEPRPATLPIHKIRLCRHGDTYAIFGNIGRFLIYKLNDHNLWSGTRLPNSVGTINSIKLAELEHVLDDGFTLCDTWSADTKFPELLES